MICPDKKHIAFNELAVGYETGFDCLTCTLDELRFAPQRQYVHCSNGWMPQQVWKQKALDLIQKHNETSILEGLVEYTKKTFPWIQSEEGRYIYALELHMLRLFEDPNWPNYIPFSLQYRPEVVSPKSIGVYVCSCGASHLLPKETYWLRRPYVSCPYCDKPMDASVKVMHHMEEEWLKNIDRFYKRDSRISL